MLEARVLSLSVLTDDGKVDIAVTGGESGNGLAQDEGSVDVELLAHGDVPRGVAGSLDRGVEDTCVIDAQSALELAVACRDHSVGVPLSPTLFLRSESIERLKTAASSGVSPETLNFSNSTGTFVC